MVTQRSEYQRQFKKSAFKRHLSAYYENVAFRNHRRDLENAHTPINWEGSEESDSSSTESLSSGSSQEKVVETEKCTRDTKSKRPPCDNPDKLNENDNLQEKGEVSNDKNAIENGNDISQVKQEKQKKYLHDETETEEQSESKENIFKRPSKTGSSSKVKAKKSKHHKSVQTMKRTHLRRPDRCQDIPVVRPKSGPVIGRRDMCPDIPISRPYSGPITGRPPFLSYGWAEHDSHQTHNVRATTDIHPTALNAKKHHEQQLQQKKQHEMDEHRKMKTYALFNKRSQKFGSSGWQSEYRDHYTTHDTIEYSKVLSARALSARKRCDWVD